MKAARINQWGQPVQIEDIAQPTPASDEVLVRVHAASLNPVDSFVVAGYLAAMVTIPMTSGTDFAGEVVSVGETVTHVKPGDSVYGLIPFRGGAFAEYVVSKANEIGLKPRSLSYEQAAAVPLSAMTAQQSLFDLAQLQDGERVLILGAGGNVGSFAVQLAKSRNAYVIASDVAEKAAFLQGLGVDEFIDSGTQQFENEVKDVDVVLNFASDALLEGAYSVLKAGGRYVTSLQQPPQDEAERRGIRSLAVFTQPSSAHFAQLSDLIDTGKVKVTVQRTFPLDEAQAALNYRQAATAPGKVVISI